MGVISLLAPVRLALTAAALLQAVSSVAGVAPFIIIVMLIAQLLHAAPTMETLWPWLLALVVALLVRSLGLLAAGFLSHLADNRLQLILRNRLCERLEQVELSWFSHHNAGEIKKTLQDDINTMHHLVAHTLLELVHVVITPALILLYLAQTNLWLTLIIALPLLVGVGLYRRQFTAFAANMGQYHQDLSHVSQAAVEMVQGVEVIKVFCQSEKASRRFQQTANGFIDRFWQWARPVIRVSALSEVLLSPAFMLLWCAAASGWFFFYQGIGTPAATGFILLGVNLVTALHNLMAAVAPLQSALAAARNVQRFMALPPQAWPAESLTPADNSMELVNVSFHYQPDKPALQNINLSLAAGSLTAIVGASGSGKTTLGRLLLRYSDPQQGEVRLGGVDLRRLSREQLKQRIGFVFQETQLLQTSLTENIALARPSAKAAEISLAAQRAAIDERISELPLGYASVPGESASLSGGEAQRVALARLFLADRPVWVLDEPASGLDIVTERRIQRSLAEIKGRHTLLVIAHNLASIVHADNIVVMAEGRIVGQGRHQQLLHTNPVYANLWLQEQGCSLHEND